MSKPLRFTSLKRFSLKARNQPTQAGQGAGFSFNVPAPTQGLNTRNDYQELQPNEARELINWLPDIGACKIRPGYQDHAELDSSTDVQGLIEYKGVSNRKLIATAGGEIHDATSTSPSVLTSAAYTSNRWRMCNFNGFLFGVNGTDTPWRYNGTAVAATGFTGPTLTTLQSIWVARNRLWVSQTNTADVRYGGIGAVTGALTTFQLSQIADGGYCVTGGAWSRDAGDGSDDYTVFVMDTGQVIVYQGDPSTNFSLVGKYMMPEPVGRNCTLKIGGDIIIMTKEGPVPLSASFQGIAFDTMAIGPWGKIAPSWKEDFITYGNGDAWTSLYANGLAIFSFPTSAASNSSKQYVFNTRRSAWTTYTGLPASSWATLNNQIYIGEFSAGNVYLHQGGQDGGMSIQAKARPGFTYPVGTARNIAINAMRPNLDTDGETQGSFVVDTDFLDKPFGNTQRVFTSAVTGADWGDDWGTDWASDPKTTKKWYGVRGYGRAIAPGLQVYSKATNTLWYSTDVMGIPGGIL